MRQDLGKPKRPWGKLYLVGVRLFCLGFLGAAALLMFRGQYIPAVALAVAGPVLEVLLYRCPYCGTRPNPKQRKLPPHCICPECKREL